MVSIYQHSLAINARQVQFSNWKLKIIKRDVNEGVAASIHTWFNSFNFILMNYKATNYFVFHEGFFTSGFNMFVKWWGDKNSNEKDELKWFWQNSVKMV